MFGRDGLQDVLSRADILFVCTPLTPETHHLIGAAEIARMKPGAGLVNLARGGVVDAAAVAAALASGHLSGALMDVFDEEPLPAASPLWDCPNLIITPHCSSDDADAYVPRTLDLIFENLRRLIDGRELRCAVRPELGY